MFARFLASAAQGSFPQLIAQSLFGDRAEKRHVGPCAESSPRTRQNDNSYLAVSLCFLNRGTYFLFHRRGPGVQLVLTVQRYRGDAIRHGVKGLFVCHTGTALYTIAAA